MTPFSVSTWQVLGDERAFGVIALGGHRDVAEFFDHQDGGVVVDGLVDGDHHAHLEQGLDHITALERELACEIGDGDRLADGNFAHHRRSRALEAVRAAAATRGFDHLAAAPASGRFTTGAAAAAVAVGGGQVQLPGKA